jgi:serine protease Do
MIAIPRLLFVTAALLLFGGTILPARSQDVPSPTASETPTVVSSTAEKIYESARDKLLQVRTVLGANGHQTTLGSAFLLGRDVAITNYHVVSQYVLEPDLYRLEYFTATGGHGNLQLLAFDIANDLAVVRIDQPQNDFFTFDSRKLEELTKGERLYAMGNPLDIGFAIVEGTYNGLVERSYSPHIHFSGALNPGMSGGPAVETDGKVVGINVATRLDGELVSFLVPAQFAAALLTNAQQTTQQGAAPSAQALRAELARQIAARQASLYTRLTANGFQTTVFGPYAAPESKADWLTCWAQTNAGQVPKPRATVETTNCESDSDLFIANDLSIGTVAIAHSYVRSVDLNRFQFATFLAQQQNRLPWIGVWREKWYTPPRCTQDFTLATKPDEGPPVEAIWCARGYKDFGDLYDVAVISITQDRNTEALVSRLGLQAVTYEDATALTKQFFEALKWKQ